MGGIRQQHYQRYMQKLINSGLAPWTLYKHQLALGEFAERRMIRIRIKPSLPGQLSKQQKEIGKVLNSVPGLPVELKNEILKAFMEKVYG